MQGFMHIKLVVLWIFSSSTSSILVYEARYKCVSGNRLENFR